MTCNEKNPRSIEIANILFILKFIFNGANVFYCLQTKEKNPSTFFTTKKQSAFQPKILYYNNIPEPTLVFSAISLYT